MNPEYCLANLLDENSANSQENISNPFEFQHVLNNGSIDPDINFCNNKFDVVDPPYFVLEEIFFKLEKFLENLFLCVSCQYQKPKQKFLRGCLNF